MIQKIIWLIIAGALGTLARYGMASVVNKFNGYSFPLGTMTVNLVGCFVVGLLWMLFENRWPVSDATRTIILVGFMGAFTTFSAFILETNHLLSSKEWMYGVGNIVLQNGLGILALFVGLKVGKLV